MTYRPGRANLAPPPSPHSPGTAAQVLGPEPRRWGTPCSETLTVLALGLGGSHMGAEDARCHPHSQAQPKGPRLDAQGQPVQAAEVDLERPGAGSTGMSLPLQPRLTWAPSQGGVERVAVPTSPGETPRGPTAAVLVPSPSPWEGARFLRRWGRPGRNNGDGHPAFPGARGPSLTGQLCTPGGSRPPCQGEVDLSGQEPGEGGSLTEPDIPGSGGPT